MFAGAYSLYFTLFLLFYCALDLGQAVLYFVHLVLFLSNSRFLIVLAPCVDTEYMHQIICSYKIHNTANYSHAPQVLFNHSYILKLIFILFLCLSDSIIDFMVDSIMGR